MAANVAFGARNECFWQAFRSAWKCTAKYTVTA